LLFAGAGGHSIELLGILLDNQYKGKIYFFDDSFKVNKQSTFEGYPLLHSIEEAIPVLKIDQEFILAVGKPSHRKILDKKLSDAGGELTSLISHKASIGNHRVKLGAGLNIMTGAVITNRIEIGKGTLVHIHTSIHHDVVIGEYCELSPGSRILGKVKLGSGVSVGAGAVVLPGIEIGDDAVIGAGAVVTKNVSAGTTVVGIPAAVIKR
jgi:sugar O-acyltransferase (sialic acid O-acetyltransferase NeuD family)